jgi:hypothetical protein
VLLHALNGSLTTGAADAIRNFGEHMALAPSDFAYSSIARSGRIDSDRRRAVAPNVMAQYTECHGAI